jgi:hypothetical protein
MTAATRRGTRMLTAALLVSSLLFTGCATSGTPSRAPAANDAPEIDNVRGPAERGQGHGQGNGGHGNRGQGHGGGQNTGGQPDNRLPDLSRVAMTRMFQHEHWTIDAVEAGSATDKIDYLCQALGPLQPTYVSGLIRLDGTEPVTAEQVEIFTGVKSCLPGTKFDVVLNAEDYYDGRAKLTDRLEQLQQSLQPHGWFFDFFTKPWKVGKAGNMQDGMRWIRDHGLFVGGNTWGAGNLPDHADFIAVTNLDGLGRATHLAKRIKQQRPDLPVLMHIRNDPQRSGSEGLDWIKASPDRRARDLHAHVATVRKSAIDHYMYPVFFPLSCQRPSGKQNGCAGTGETHRSYDARDDQLLRRICLEMGRPASECAAIP